MSIFLKMIENILFVRLPANLKKDFKIEISRINVTRAKSISIAFFIIEMLMLPIFYFSKKDEIFSYPNTAYLLLYIINLSVMLIYTVIFFRLAGDPVKNEKRILIAGLSFCFYVLLWCGGITLLDQLSSGQVIVYTMACISIAVCPIFEPLAVLVIFITVHILFAVMLPVFQSSPELLFGNYINTTTNLIISWTISRILYKSKVNDFINSYLVREKNEELKEINKKLLESNQKLEELSITDSLTGLYNRRKFNELLSSNWETCRRYSLPISLIMIDIDYFKSFNDIYGHQAGDECIKMVTGKLSDMVRRSSDIVARYGGEEFIIAMTGIKSQEANLFAEQVRKQIESLNIHHEGSLISDYVTISLGVCTAVPSLYHSISELIDTSDKALYKAKSNNRNTTVAMELDS